MPINLDTSFPRSAFQIRNELMEQPGVRLSDRKRLDDLYQCLRQQVRNGVQPARCDAEAYVGMVKDDDQVGWLIEKPQEPLFCEVASGSMGVGGAVQHPGQPEPVPHWRDLYEVGVIQIRNALAGQLTQTAHDAGQPDPTHTRDQMIQASLWRVSMDAQALARIATSGYVLAQPLDAVEASALLDALKQDVEVFRPQLEKLLMQSYPKKPPSAAQEVSSAAPVPPEGYPAARWPRHASDSPRDAVRWHV